LSINLLDRLHVDQWADHRTGLEPTAPAVEVISPPISFEPLVALRGSSRLD
jgi:hypothetical protein